MKPPLRHSAVWSILQLLFLAHAGFAGNFTIKIQVTKLGTSEPVVGTEVTLQRYYDDLKNLQPGTTDSQGVATIRFSCDAKKPKVKFIVVAENSVDETPWRLLRHGILPDPFKDCPFECNATDESLPLLALKDNQVGGILASTLTKDCTVLFSSAVASLTTLPNSAAGVDKLPDPSALPKKLAELMHTSTEAVKSNLLKWGQLVNSAGEGKKLDEKFLVAWAAADTTAAANYALMAEKLTGDEKRQMLDVLSDTGRISATLVRYGEIANKFDPNSAKVKDFLERTKLLEARLSDFQPIKREAIEDSTLKRLKYFHEAGIGK